jgi:hypothetical protein
VVGHDSEVEPGESTLRWLALFLAAALSACASDDGRTPEGKAAAWEAANVYPANYRGEIIAYLRTYLNDPTNIREAQVSEPTLRPAGFGNRYMVCLRFNTKRAGGGYGGAREHIAIFLGGKLDRMVDLRGGDQARGEQGKGEQCSSATYAAFPELERLTR